jgi:hypothetical protein
VAAPKVKVEQVKFTTPKTSTVDENGEVTDNGWQSHGSYQSWRITHEDYPDINLQYVAHHLAKFGENHSNQGRMILHVEDWDGSVDSMESAFSLISEMGVDMSEATEESLELFFWRHLSGIFCDRLLNTASEFAVKKTLSGMDSNLDPETELALRKGAFDTLWGTDIVNGADWKPHFSHYRAHLEQETEVLSGHPYWLRPDFNLDDYEKWTGGVLPSRNDGNGVQYLTWGAYASNEEKIRFTGEWGHSSYSTFGVSSADDDRRQGSGQFAFVRQGQFLEESGMYVEPMVFARTSNYSFSHDNYGNVSEREDESPFDFKSMVCLGYSKALKGKSSVGGTYNGSNETLIKYGWSTWDDVAIIRVTSDAARKSLLDYYAQRGISEVRGISLEERIVSNTQDAMKTMVKVWALAKKVTH